MGNQLQRSEPDSLQVARQNLSATEVLSERLLPSEAMAIAADLLECFPNCKAEDGFVRALAEGLFMHYPPSVVGVISDAFVGLPAFSSFLSIEAAKKWLDTSVRPIHEEAERDRIAAEQSKQLPWIDEPPSKSGLEKARTWLRRIDPRAKELNGISDESRERQNAIDLAKSQQVIEREGQLRVAEYIARGLNPVYADAKRTIVCSLPLLLSLGWRVVEEQDGPTLINPQGKAA